jgi:hypothetical protein
MENAIFVLDTEKHKISSHIRVIKTHQNAIISNV